MWLYGSGFPKSMNIGLAIDKKNGVKSEVVGTGKSGSSDTHTRCMNSETKDGKSVFGGEYEIKKAQNEWNGWGTALKPSFEPIIVARKPLEGTCIDNVLKYGTGGINIDECRVGNEKLVNKGMSSLGVMHDDNWISDKEVVSEVNGRFPANTILTYDDTDFEEVCGGFPSSAKPNGSITNPNLKNSLGNNGIYNTYSENQPLWNAYQDSGSASRYFYCAKASKKDREEGLNNLPDGLLRRMRPDKDDNNPTGLNKEGRFAPVVRKNIHPTVKPTSLMQYLVRLVTKTGGNTRSVYGKWLYGQGCCI